MTAPGWFADRTDEPRHDKFPWQPFFQDDLGCFPLPVWFESGDMCDQYIRTHLVGANHFHDATR